MRIGSSFFDQGSYRQNVSTGINSITVDRDVAVEFDLDITTFTDPREVKKCVRDALKIKKLREPEIKEPCVTVEYLSKGEENIHIDFPVYAIYNGTRYLARGKEFSKLYEWESCDPHGLNDFLDNLFAGDAGNQLRRIVRYLKKWKIENYGESFSKDQMPPSISLTLMAGDVFVYQTNDGQDDDLAALSIVVKGIMDKFQYDFFTEMNTIQYNLPVKPFSNVFYKMTDKYQDIFYKKLSNLCTKVQNAVDVSEEYEAAKFLQSVFGTDFELPPKPQSKTGTARKEYSYA